MKSTLPEAAARRGTACPDSTACDSLPTMDDKPVVAQARPYILQMESGEYFWCRCGRSRTQPFCDGSHKGTAFTPIRVDVPAPRQMSWCGCKHTRAGHLCDGSHEKFR